MRYKIAFSFPVLDQKHLQLAHSNFAFSAWISLLLMVLMIQTIAKYLPERVAGQFNALLILSLALMYGMLIAFTLQGYGAFSIFFASATLLVSMAFCTLFYKSSRKLKDLAGKPWFNVALIFVAISTLGSFYLSYMMATGTTNQHAYLGAVYWFLHFQYNGWFFFASMGLLINLLHAKNITIASEKKAFLALAITCIPTYGLSILWAQLPFWVYLIIVVASMIQLYGWSILLIDLVKQRVLKKLNLGFIGKLLIIIPGLAYSVKILLQTASVIPSMSDMAFGFRPIVIAYLHLVLLASFSIFLFGYLYIKQENRFGNFAKNGLLLFIIGVILNEAILGTQGIASVFYINFPYVNEILFGIALLIFAGVSLIQIPQKDVEA
ncbi:MAG: hypothetical protein ABI002_12555 [Saprospiraceae bacterium]